jgi:hypothetical protein
MAVVIANQKGKTHATRPTSTTLRKRGRAIARCSAARNCGEHAHAHAGSRDASQHFPPSFIMARTAPSLRVQDAEATTP